MNFHYSILTITHTHTQTHTHSHARTHARAHHTHVQPSQKSTDKPTNKLANKTLSLLFWACPSIRLSARCRGHSNSVIFNRNFSKFHIIIKLSFKFEYSFFFGQRISKKAVKMAATTGLSLSHYNRFSSKFYIWIASIKLSFNMFLKMLSFGSKECTKELKLECANFLGQTC